MRVPGLNGRGALMGLALLAPSVGSAAADVVRPTIVAPTIDRPDIRSYQPYSGLQFGFRPEPPGQRGIRPDRDSRPRVVKPIPVSPLIEYDPRAPFSGPSYRFCSRAAGCR